MTPGTVAAGEGTGADGQAVAAALAGTSWVSLPLLKPERSSDQEQFLRDPTAHGTDGYITGSQRYLHSWVLNWLMPKQNRTFSHVILSVLVSISHSAFCMTISFKKKKFCITTLISR